MVLMRTKTVCSIQICKLLMIRIRKLMNHIHLSNFRRILPQRLTGLLLGLLERQAFPIPVTVTVTVIAFRIEILLEKPPRGILHGGHHCDNVRYNCLLDVGFGVDVVYLSHFDQVTVVGVAGMLVDRCSSAG